MIQGAAAPAPAQGRAALTLGRRRGVAGSDPSRRSAHNPWAEHNVYAPADRSRLFQTRSFRQPFGLRSEDEAATTPGR